MAEVASNIEQRTTFQDVKRMLELKVERSEVQYMIQNKVSADEMKNYFDQMNQIKYNPLQEEIRDEIMTLKRKLEDNANQANLQIQSVRNQN